MSDEPLGSAATLAVTPKTKSELLRRVGYIVDVSIWRREQTLHAFLQVSSKTCSSSVWNCRGRYVSFVSDFLSLDFCLHKPYHMHPDD